MMTSKIFRKFCQKIITLSPVKSSKEWLWTDIIFRTLNYFEARIKFYFSFSFSFIFSAVRGKRYGKNVHYNLKTDQLKLQSV